MKKLIWFILSSIFCFSADDEYSNLIILLFHAVKYAFYCLNKRYKKRNRVVKKASKILDALHYLTDLLN